MWEHLAAFLLASLALGAPTLAVAGALRDRGWCERPLSVLVASAGTTFFGYVAFWAWFASPGLGASWTLFCMVATLAAGWRFRHPVVAGLRDAEIWRPLLLSTVIGLFYIAVLHLFSTPFDADALATHRFMQNMPVDNELPRRFAERLVNGDSPRHLFGDWLSSDRPPLQCGVILLVWPVLGLAGVPLVTAAHAASMWFELLWVPAVWALTRSMGVDARRAPGVVALVALTGVTLFHTLYVWPKLGGGALALGAFVLYASTGRASMAMGVLSGLAWLAHGATVFSLIALAAMAGWWWPRPPLRGAAAAIAAFVLLAAPWMAYQKFYEPPGNRLVKWHLAGVIAPDARGTLEALVDEYKAAGPSRVARNKLTSLATLFKGFDEITLTIDPSIGTRRRVHEFYYFFRSLGVWNIPLAIAPLLWWRRWRQVPASIPPLARAALAWVGLTLLVWALLVFGPSGTVIHAGSLAAHLALYPVAFALAWTISRWFFAAVAVVQLVTFATTWLPAGVEIARRPLSPSAAGVAAAGAGLLAALVVSPWLTQAREVPEHRHVESGEATE